MSDQKVKLSRRDLLKTAAIGGLGISAFSSQTRGNAADHETAGVKGQKQQTMMGVKFEPRDVVRVGLIGVGLRGTDVLGEFLAIDKVVVNAVCDVVKEKCLRAAQLVEKAGQKTPAIYSNGERDFEQLSKRDDLDFIYIATPWEWQAARSTSCWACWAYPKDSAGWHQP